MMEFKMATTAFSRDGGNISRVEPSLCFITHEDADNYYGNWEGGFSFFDVRFPKVSTRDLTPDEIDKYCRAVLTVNGHPAYGYSSDNGRLVTRSIREIIIER